MRLKLECWCQNHPRVVGTEHLKIALDPRDGRLIGTCRALKICESLFRSPKLSGAVFTWAGRLSTALG